MGEKIPADSKADSTFIANDADFVALVWLLRKLESK